MPQKKKNFINRKNCTKINISELRDQIGLDSYQIVGEKPEDRVQRLKYQEDCGIFFDDDYDYMQHLREVSSDEKKSSDQASFITPSEKKEEERELCEVLNSLDVVPEVDEGDSLEDDFVDLAEGPVEVKEDAPNSSHAHFFPEFPDTNEMFSDDDFEGFYDEEDENSGDDLIPAKKPSVIPEEYKSVSSSEIRQFSSPEDKEFLKKFIEHQQYEEEEANDEEYDSFVPIEEKRQIWDCESVLSFNSNLYNHPVLIGEQRSNRKISLTETKAALHEDQDMEVDKTERSFKNSNWTAAARKGESSQDKKLRKSEIKKERRERRIEKKATKMVFGAARDHRNKSLSTVSKERAL